MPSVERGPNTLVFDVDALREFPNAAAAIEGTDTRRSDMVWSLLNRHIGGRRVVQAPLPVRQHRSASPGSDPGFGTLAQDIRGHALYSALHDILLRKVQQRQAQGREPHGRSLLDFDEDEIGRAAALYRNHLRERLRDFELNSIRVTGLIRALRPFCERDPSGPLIPWWLESPRYEGPAERLKRFTETLASVYSEERVEEFLGRLSEEDTAPIKDYFGRLRQIVEQYRANVRLPIEALARTAETFVCEEFGTGPLTCLGVGEEGVVLTDGQMAYKHFHSWKPRNMER